MSIEFNCPKCGALIAFADQHAGKRARCMTCDHRFIIPETSFKKPKRTSQPEYTEPDTPLPGFYKAAFAGSWSMLWRSSNVVGLTLVCSLVGFKFIWAHVDYSFMLMDRLSILLPIGLIIRILCWGTLFWYYLETIVCGSLDVEGLPDVDISDGTDFLRKAISSVFAFGITLLFCMVPTILYIIIAGQAQSALIANILVNAGLFFLPIAILAVGVNQDTQVLWQFHTLFAPVTKAFFPYLVCAGWVMLVWFLQMKMHTAGDPELANTSNWIKTLHFGFHLGIQVLALMAMRNLGLFYRHYQCYFKW